MAAILDHDVAVVRGGRTEWVFNTSTGTEKPYTFEGQRYLVAPRGDTHWVRNLRAETIKTEAHASLERLRTVAEHAG